MSTRKQEQGKPSVFAWNSVFHLWQMVQVIPLYTQDEGRAQQIQTHYSFDSACFDSTWEISVKVELSLTLPLVVAAVVQISATCVGATRHWTRQVSRRISTSCANG